MREVDGRRGRDLHRRGIVEAILNRMPDSRKALPESGAEDHWIVCFSYSDIMFVDD